jgi:hypothetical protein
MRIVCRLLPDDSELCFAQGEMKQAVHGNGRFS